MRVIVLLLASILFVGMTAVAGQGASASSDVVGVVSAVAVPLDDAPELDAPVVVESSALPAPDRRGPVRIEASPVPAHGRMHAVLVFRPPRLVVSR